MIRILVFPRSETDPYQGLLYGAMPAGEVEVHYLPMPTWSQTINLVLLPFFLALYRLRGCRILHVHWVYLFAPVWAALPGGRRLLQWWFKVCLATARLLRYRIVWTAHNVLPLSQVFADDAAARRLLAAAATAVIAHNASTVPAILAYGARNVEHIPIGPRPYHTTAMTRAEARQRLGLGENERVVAFVGSVEEYKGADLLLAAAHELEGHEDLRILIAGPCRSAKFRHRITPLLEAATPRVMARLEFIPEQELQVYLTAADFSILPFRRVTNSSSLLLALGFGLPVIIPDLPELQDISADVAIRFEHGNRRSLLCTLKSAATMDPADVAAMSREAKAFVSGLSWERTARETLAVYRSALFPS